MVKFLPVLGREINMIGLPSGYIPTMESNHFINGWVYAYFESAAVQYDTKTEPLKNVFPPQIL